GRHLDRTRSLDAGPAARARGLRRRVRRGRGARRRSRRLRAATVADRAARRALPLPERNDRRAQRRDVRSARRGDGRARRLDRVGLGALAERETSTLSGGELQRLAVAAALARRPQLLISDESTAMVDASGRAQLVALFRELAHTDGLGVLHVTHRAAEAAVAD